MKTKKLQLMLSAAALVAFGTAAQAAPTFVAGPNTFTSTQLSAVAPGMSSGGTVSMSTAGGPSAIHPTSNTVTGLNASWGGGLAGSAHDFVMGGGGILTNTAATTNTESIGLCTFCHTPHKASTTLLLWNHTLSSNTFNWNVAATTSGTALPGFVGSTYNGPSAKCLSCHDGSVAVGDVGWFDDASHVGANALNTFVMTSASDKLVGQGGNLKGNHPVAIPYPYNGAPNVYNGSTTGKYLATDQFVSDPTQNNIRLYADLGGDTIVGHPVSGKTGIECSSCHDPHNKASRGDFFLRGNLTGDSEASGYICLQCHIK